MNVKMKTFRFWPAIFALALFLGGCRNEEPVFQGYIEGEYLYLASSQAGRLEYLPVRAGDEAAPGEALFRLESELERNKLRQAEGELKSARDKLADLKSALRPTEVAALKAQVDEARAALENSTLNLKRSEALYKSGSLAKSRLDADRTQAEADAARVEQLESRLATAQLPTGRDEQILAQAAVVEALEAAQAQARWYLGEKEVRAPAGGLIQDIFYRPGEWVPAGTPVLRMLPPENLKVKFFVPEKEFRNLAPGLAVRVEVAPGADVYPAVISFLSTEAEYTPPIIYSNESREKLVFMGEARLTVAAGLKLKPGQPAAVRIGGGHD